VDLISGLLRPDSGQIWIDDTSLEEVDLHAWRSMIGYVPQETGLLHDSVLNNVTLGDPGLTEHDVEAALRAAGAWQFVASLPDGLNSVVGERGAMLSGGQRQRIVIARALVHKPALLILDEATSALDQEVERDIHQALNELRSQMTLLSISHRPNLEALADRVYHLEAGTLTLATTRNLARSRSQ
jgi:ATP-binding cassette subfamily C protein